MQNSNTDVKILSIACELLATGGLGAVSFDAIARRLGRSKQAVLYWYPTKRDLMAAMFLPWLAAETETAVGAISNATNRIEAISSFVGAVASFHLADLDRFRMMYLAPQTTRLKSNAKDNIVNGDAVYEVTNRLYSTLADHLGGQPEVARKDAVAIHSAVLGVVLMFAMADAMGDPLKHSATDLIDALIANLTAIR